MNQTSKKLNEFCLKFKLQEFPAKTILLTPNSIPQYIYFLEDGFVRNFIATNDGNELSISIFKNKTLIPFASLFHEVALTCFFYETVSKSSLRIIPINTLLEFLKNNSDTREEFSNIYISNINLLMNKTKELLFHDTNYRIISTLINLADELGVFGQDTIDFKLNLTHELIASFAGTTRETVTRKLNELKLKGYISKNYNSLKIVRLQELRDSITLNFQQA